MKKIIVLSMALMACGGVFAQEHKMDAAHKQEMMKDLNLSEQQKTQMKALHEKHMAEFKAMKEKHDAEMKAILTPEQYQKIQARKEARRSQMMQKMQQNKAGQLEKKPAVPAAETQEHKH